MRQYFNIIIRLILLFTWSISICSCQLIIKETSCVDIPDSESAAKNFISTVKSENNEKISVKGIGRITVWNPDGTQTFRAAWVGASDGRLHVEILGLSGRPVAKFIYDGKNYIFISLPDQYSYRGSGSNSNLKRLTGIEISSADIVKYLSGSIPLCDYDTAVFQSGGTKCDNTIALKRRWHGVVERIYLDNSHTGIEKLERYKRGNLVYAVELGQKKVVGGHKIPFALRFSDGKARGFKIAIERCWLDIHVTPEMFSIENDEPRK